MIKCKICESGLVPHIDKHYIARDRVKTGLAVIVSGDESTLYDAFDCPVCGCQIIAQERKRCDSFQTLGAHATDDDDDEDIEEEDGEECDGES